MKSKLELKATTCILIASKYDELDDRIPFIKDLQKLSRYEFSYKDCQDEEDAILR
jgi:hypothetical protein